MVNAKQVEVVDSVVSDLYSRLSRSWPENDERRAYRLALGIWVARLPAIRTETRALRARGENVAATTLEAAYASARPRLPRRGPPKNGVPRTDVLYRLLLEELRIPEPLLRESAERLAARLLERRPSLA